MFTLKWSSFIRPSKQAKINFNRDLFSELSVQRHSEPKVFKQPNRGKHRTFLVWCECTLIRTVLQPCKKDATRSGLVFLTQIVVDKLSWEGRLLMFPTSVNTGTGIRCVHRENIGTDTHQFCLSHQLPDGWSTGGQRSWQFLPWDPCLRPCVPGQLSFCPVLLQASRDTGL